jgi:Family of unknown function (DUF5317)
VILVILTLLGVAAVPALGGRLQRLATLRLRNSWVIGAALGAQVVLLAALRSAPSWQTDTIHVASYVVAGGFVWQNRRLRGLPLAALGGLCNFAAITANGGVMPASAAAFRAVGRVVDASEFANSGPMAHPKLLFLGDVIPFPYPHAVANVFSIGDLLLITGIVLVVHTTCGSSLRRRRPNADAPVARTAVDTAPSTATVAPADPATRPTSAWAPPVDDTLTSGPSPGRVFPIDLLPLAAPADGRSLVDA